MIEILYGYRNRRVQLYAGMYSENDERLQGLGDYLIANGHAVTHEDAPIIEPQSDLSEIPAVEDAIPTPPENEPKIVPKRKVTRK